MNNYFIKHFICNLNFEIKIYKMNILNNYYLNNDNNFNKFSTCQQLIYIF